MIQANMSNGLGILTDADTATCFALLSGSYCKELLSRLEVREAWDLAGQQLAGEGW